MISPTAPCRGTLGRPCTRCSNSGRAPTIEWVSDLGRRRVRIAAALIRARPVPGRDMLAMMALLCGLFLAHGLQCAVTHADDGHSAGVSVSGGAHSPGVGAITPAILMSAEAHSVATDRDSARHGGQPPFHVALACVAVLGAVFLLVALLAGRSQGPRRRLRVERVRTLLLRAGDWRPAAPAMSVLCVSRT